MNTTPDLPPLTCERTQISQSLVNLIMNSRDAMPSGGTITIRTRFEPEGQLLLLEIGDNGSGIPLELQKKIFEPFFTTKPPDKGTGLGLSNVQNVARTHGGYIRLDSTPGQGSRFTICFPIKASS